MFAKKFMQFLWGVLVSNLFNVLTMLVLTWKYAPKDVAISTLFATAANFGLLLGTLGLDQYFIRAFNGKTSAVAKSKLLRLCIIPPLLFCGVFLAALTLQEEESVSSFLLGSGDGLLLPLCAFSVVLGITERFAQLSLRMAESGNLFSTAISAKAVINTVVVWGFAYNLPTYTGIIAGILVSQIASTALSIAFYPSIWKFVFKRGPSTEANLKEGLEGLKEDSQESPQTDLKSELKSDLKTALKFSWPFIPAYIFTWGVQNLDRYFLKEHISISELGQYLIAVKIAGIAKIAQTAFTTFFIPAAFKDAEYLSKDELAVRYGRLFRFSYDTSFLGLAVLTLFSSKITMALGPDYQSIDTLVPILLFVPAITLLSEIPNVGINLSNKTGFHILASSISVLILCGSLWVLVPGFKAEGAAVSVFITALVFFGCRYCFGIGGFSLKFSKVHFLLSLSLISAYLFVNLYAGESITVSLFFVAAQFFMAKNSLAELPSKIPMDYFKSGR